MKQNIEAKNSGKNSETPKTAKQKLTKRKTVKQKNSKAKNSETVKKDALSRTKQKCKLKGQFRFFLGRPSPLC